LIDLWHALLIVGLAMVTSGYAHSTIILILLFKKNEVKVGDVTILEPRRWVLVLELILTAIGWIFIFYAFGQMLQVTVWGASGWL